MSGIPFNVEGPDDPTRSARRTQPEYVKLYPSDSDIGLSPVFWKGEESPSLPLPLDSVNGADESNAVRSPTRSTFPFIHTLLI